jgi:hypothetical protein
MSGCIIKCPACGKGRINFKGDARISSKTHSKLFGYEKSRISDNHTGANAYIFGICSRCGHIVRKCDFVGL